MYKVFRASVAAEKCMRTPMRRSGCLLTVTSPSMTCLLFEVGNLEKTKARAPILRTTINN